VREVPIDRLLNTSEASKAIGVSRGTLAKYVRDGVVRPYLTLPSGQYRWRLPDLLEQLRKLGPSTTQPPE
jgi:predicted site-specific integrase-resolvase